MKTKFAVMIMGPLMATSACALPGLPGSDDESATVSVVNAEPVLGSESEGDGESVEGRSDGDDGAVTTTVVVDSADQDDAEADSDTNDADSVAPVVSGPDVIEMAGPEAIALVGTEDRMSTNPGNLTRGNGYLAVDRVYTTGLFDDIAANPGSKIAVVEYQLSGLENGNFFDESLRVIAGGETYPTLTSINETPRLGKIFNSRAIFEIPSDATSLVVEGGAPEGELDGFTTRYDVALSPSDGGPLPIPAATEAASVGITLVSDNPRMSTNPERADRGSGNLTIDAARAVTKIEAESALPGFRFVIFDYQLLGIDDGNFFEHAFRVEANGEWYTPIGNINEIVDPGLVYNGQLFFHLPADADELRLEGGTTERQDEGFRTEYTIMLDSAATADADEPVTDVAVEAEASEITLVSSEDVMSTNTGNVGRGWGRLSIDAARSTAKIEQFGAAPGFKYVVIDYQLLGVSGGNFFEHAFRLRAEGEWYSPIGNINEIVDEGVVFNGELVFEVPAGASMLILEGGMPEGSPEGFTVRYEVWL